MENATRKEAEMSKIAKREISGDRLGMIDFYIQDEDNDYLYFKTEDMRSVRSNLEIKSGGMWDFVNKKGSK